MKRRAVPKATCCFSISTVLKISMIPFGHEDGDEFLVQLGQFFSGIPLLHEAIYRNGGDEFVAIIDGDKTEANIRNLAKFIHQRFAAAWELKRGDAFCNVSIGVAALP